MVNKAKEIMIPIESHIFRTIFLYVGQGDSTILAIPDGDNYKYVLIDSNNDESCGGINIIKMLEDLFEDEDNKLEVYINTHPHNDHLGKIKEIYENIGIKQLWHSGHKPGKDHEEAYKDLEFVIKKLGGKNVFCLKGSKEDNKLDDETIRLGDINYNILAPANYVIDDIENEKPEDRSKRIHEQCGVIRLKYGKEEKEILITGDADYNAWKNHITKYHKERLPSIVLSAPHHGSNSFFWEECNTEDKPYEEHLNAIEPTYVVISAPKKEESKHGHPDKEAMELYKKKAGNDNVFHLGKERICVIVDINENGDIEIYPDDELVEEYGFKKNNGNGKKEAIFSTTVTSRIDNKPMGF